MQTVWWQNEIVCFNMLEYCPCFGREAHTDTPPKNALDDLQIRRSIQEQNESALLRKKLRKLRHRSPLPSTPDVSFSLINLAIKSCSDRCSLPIDTVDAVC